MKITLLLATLLFSPFASAGVFKCTNAEGQTAYQTTPCPEAINATEINPVTGASKDLRQAKLLKGQELEKQQEQLLLKQEQLKKQEQLEQATLEESLKNQQLIKDNPGKFSAFAIPPYADNKHPGFANQFTSRLPAIERFRRNASEIALASGKCGRVEASELNPRSTAENLVILIDCSSGESFYIDEQQITALD